MSVNPFPQIDPKEEAFLYDLYIAPQWGEAFHELVDAELKLPKDAVVLDAGCGTGGLALGLASSLGSRSSTLGIDPSAERIEIARAKAQLKKLDRLTFQTGSIDATGLASDQFDLVIGDATMWPSERIPDVLAELHRVARPGGKLVLLLTTRGSFDEFFSLYWESLHELGLDRYTEELEKLITARLTPSEYEQMARSGGWQRVRSVTRKERFDYSDGAAFLSAPLFARYFLPDWLSLVADEREREDVRYTLINLIDRERHEMDFDVSIKATILLGQK